MFHLLAITIACLGVLTVPAVLYENAFYQGMEFGDSAASEEVSLFFGYVLTVILMAYLLNTNSAVRSRSLYESEARRLVDDLNGHLAGGAETMSAIDKSLQEVARDLGISAPDAVWTPLPAYVESHGPRALSEPDALREYVGGLNRRGTELLNRLADIAQRRREASELLRRTALGVNRRSGISSFILELENHDLALSSDNLIELIEQHRWDAVHIFLDVRRLASEGAGEDHRQGNGPGAGAVVPRWQGVRSPAEGQRPQGASVLGSPQQCRAHLEHEVSRGVETRRKRERWSWPAFTPAGCGCIGAFAILGCVERKTARSSAEEVGSHAEPARRRTIGTRSS